MKTACILLFCIVLGTFTAFAKWDNGHENGAWLDSVRRVYFRQQEQRSSIEKMLRQKLHQQKDSELQAFSALIEFTGQIDQHPLQVDLFYEQIEKRFEVLPNIKAMAYQTIGYYYFFVNVNYEKAFNSYFKLEKLLQVYDNHTVTNYANYCAEISLAYFKFKDYEKSMELAKKGVVYASKKWEFYNTIGLCYMERDKIDSAIHFLQQAADVAVSKKMRPVYRTISLGNIGYGYYRKKEFGKAKPLIRIDLDEALRIGDYGLAAGAEIPLADIYLTEKNWKVGKALLDSAGKHIHLSGQLDRLEKFFPVLSRYHQLRGNQQLALAYSDSTIKAIKVNDSAFNNLLVMRVQQRTDMEKLAEEKNKLENYKKVSRTRILGLVVVFILVLVVILLIRHYLSRIESDKKQIAELNRILDLRQRLSADMHDDIGSTLSSISLYTHSLLLQPQADMQRNTLEKIKQNAQNVQEYVSDIIWSLNPIMDSMEQVVARMRAFGADMTEHADIEFQFMASEQVSEVSLAMNSRKNLYLIYKEIINNAVKYSSCKKVTVLLKLGDVCFEMNVEDDGIGFDVAAKCSGNGLPNMRRRAEEIGATITISSVKQKGTTIKLTVPS